MPPKSPQSLSCKPFAGCRCRFADTRRRWRCPNPKRSSRRDYHLNTKVAGVARSTCSAHYDRAGVLEGRLDAVKDRATTPSLNASRLEPVSLLPAGSTTVISLPVAVLIKSDEIVWAESNADARGQGISAGLGAEAGPNPDRKPPKVISPSDPCSAWTAKANKRVQFGYGLNYLIDSRTR